MRRRLAAQALSTESWYSNRRGDEMILEASLWAEPRCVILAISQIVEDALKGDLERVKGALSRFPFEDFSGDGPAETMVRVSVAKLLGCTESGEDARAVCLRMADRWCWDDVSRDEIANCRDRCQGLHYSFEYAASHVGAARAYATIKASSCLTWAARDVAEAILCYLDGKQNPRHLSYHRRNAGEFASRALSGVSWGEAYLRPHGKGEEGDKVVRDEAFDGMAEVVRKFIPEAGQAHATSERR